MNQEQLLINLKVWMGGIYEFHNEKNNLIVELGLEKETREDNVIKRQYSRCHKTNYLDFNSLIDRLGVMGIHSVIIINSSFFFAFCSMISLGIFCSLPKLQERYKERMKQVEKTRKYNLKLIESKMQ